MSPRILSSLVVLAIGIGLLLLMRRRLSNRSMSTAVSASIAVVATTLLIAGEFFGLARSLAPAALIASSFIGAIISQPNPWAPSSVLRGLAISTGCIALVSAVRTDFLVALLALVGTGVLVVLLSRLAPDSPIHAKGTARANAG